MTDTDVAIIGAGPNGLALAAHLKAVGVEHVVLGRSFSTWRDHMPRGMMLKSEPYGSDVAAPFEGYRIRDFCRSTGAHYVDRVEPLKLATFLWYADWFTRRLVPGVHEANVTSLAHSEDGFSLYAESGLGLTARRVVVASGLIPFAYVPAVLKALPDGLISHTSAHTDPGRFSGRRVGLVGAGQSALELAALLNEAGAEVEVIARPPALYFHPPMAERRAWWEALRQPASPHCEGWHCWGYYHLPDLFRALPEHERVVRSRTFLGPAGARWLRPRVEGQMAVHAGARIIEARPAGAASQAGAGCLPGRRREAQYDHVIAGTGYRLDLDRLGFLSQDLRKAVSVAGGAPVLSRSFESSVPGLLLHRRYGRAQPWTVDAVPCRHSLQRSPFGSPSSLTSAQALGRGQGAALCRPVEHGRRALFPSSPPERAG